MASHSLAIAKASLAAGLMRPDPVSVLKTDISQFYRLLDALLFQCSATNIQLCKEWLLKNIAPSVDKTKAIGKYLVALSASLSSTDDIDVTNQAKQGKVSSRRRQLHIIYLLHDFLHHVNFHGARLANGAGVIRTLETYVTELVTLAATYDPNKYKRHFDRLDGLINVWDESNQFPSSVLAAFRDNVSNAANRTLSVARNAEPAETTIDTAGTGAGGNQKDAPYIMPASHGDTSVPFYDLPAGNLMPCIIPNSMAPISPQMIKPLQFRAGPADEQLAGAVKAFLQDIDVLYGVKLPKRDCIESDIDQLGQPITLNDTLGDVPVSDGYYGWSRAFCEKMKLRSNGKLRTGSPLHLGMSQQSQRRRRRRSSSTSRRSFSHSSATSRSRSRGKDAGHRRRRVSDSRSRSHSSQRNHLTSDDRRNSPPAGASSRSRSRSYSPPDVAADQERIVHVENNAVVGLGREPFPQVAPIPPVFLQQRFLSSGQLPVPPPRPPNYTGLWPPPPPPPPPSLSTQMFVSQNQGQVPPLPTSSQPPSHLSGLGSTQALYGQASNELPSQGHQGRTGYTTGQLGHGQAPQARGHGSQW